jgi:hypothetical protein
MRWRSCGNPFGSLDEVAESSGDDVDATAPEALDRELAAAAYR